MNGNNSEILQELQKVSRLLALSYVQSLEQPDNIIKLAASGFGNTEISDLLGISPGTVGSAISRAKKAGKLK